MSKIATADYKLRAGWRCMYFQFTAEFVEDRTPEQLFEFMRSVLVSRIKREPALTTIEGPTRQIHMLSRDQSGNLEGHYYDARIEYSEK